MKKQHKNGKHFFIINKRFTYYRAKYKKAAKNFCIFIFLCYNIKAFSFMRP